MLNLKSRAAAGAALLALAAGCNTGQKKANPDFAGSFPQPGQVAPPGAGARPATGGFARPPARDAVSPLQPATFTTGTGKPSGVRPASHVGGVPRPEPVMEPPAPPTLDMPAAPSTGGLPPMPQPGSSGVPDLKLPNMGGGPTTGGVPTAATPTGWNRMGGGSAPPARPATPGLGDPTPPARITSVPAMGGPTMGPGDVPQVPPSYYRGGR